MSEEGGDKQPGDRMSKGEVPGKNDRAQQKDNQRDAAAERYEP